MQAVDESWEELRLSPRREDFMKRSKRKTTDLSESLHHRLDGYALAASVAGVSLLALAQPSEGKIVYTHVHRVISDGQSFMLDLNHDDITDLTLKNKFYTGNCYTSECSHFQRLAVRLAPGNGVVYDVFGAVAMKQGMRVGPNRGFHGNVETMAQLDTFRSRPPFGSWLNVSNRYLGLKFKIKGEIHYGWARLTVNVQLLTQITATLTGFAYETIPNKPIITGNTIGPDDSDVEEPNASLAAPTPQPTTLGMLALGSPALSIWRREEPVGASAESN